MKRFAQFVLENATPKDLAPLKSLIEKSDYSDKLKQKFLDAVGVVEQFVSGSPVYKADGDASKSTLNQFFSHYGDQVARKYYGVAKEKNIDVFVGIDMNGAAKILRGLEKDKSHVPEYYLVADLASSMNTIFKQMKPALLSGRKPKPVSTTSGYTKPMAPLDAQKTVFKILKDASDDIHKKLTSIFVEQEKTKFDDIVELVKAKNITSRNGFKGPNEKYLPLYHRYFEDGSVVKSPEKIYTKFGETTANDIIDGFIAKNTSKISLLFSKKSELKAHKILENRVNPNGVLENKMRFEFVDGSAFSIYSKVEFSQSSNNKIFIRVPTRFTDVILADGTKMSQPSEEKMDKEF